jgi:hypothetical protein
VRERRTGWVEQLGSFGTRWEGARSDGRAGVRFGPACATLGEALAWCEHHCRRAFVDLAAGGRHAVGLPRDGFPPLPATLPRASSWPRASRGHRWAVDVTFDLGFEDHTAAAPVFEHALRSFAEVEDAWRDDVGGRLGARVVVAAPTDALAVAVASGHGRRALTDRADGLLDELGEALSARVGEVRATVR